MTPREILDSIYKVDQKLSKLIVKMTEAEYDAFIDGNEKLKKYDEILAIPEVMTESQKAFFTPDMFYTINKYIDAKMKELHL